MLEGTSARVPDSHRMARMERQCLDRSSTFGSAFSGHDPSETDRQPYGCRLLIAEVNANHELRTPDALARNVPLIRELNGNVSRVSGAQYCRGLVLGVAMHVRGLLPSHWQSMRDANRFSLFWLP